MGWLMPKRLIGLGVGGLWVWFFVVAVYAVVATSSSGMKVQCLALPPAPLEVEVLVERVEGDTARVRVNPGMKSEYVGYVPVASIHGCPKVKGER